MRYIDSLITEASSCSISRRYDIEREIQLYFKKELNLEYMGMKLFAEPNEPELINISFNFMTPNKEYYKFIDFRKIFKDLDVIGMHINEHIFGFTVNIGKIVRYGVKK